MSYIEREICPVPEARPGSLGISVLEDRERTEVPDEASSEIR